jgi:superfamily II DNA/RNA helicase
LINTDTEITSSAGLDDTVAPAATPATITFADFGLDPKIQKAVSEQGYTIPTPIQAQSIPHVLAGRDLMGAAQLALVKQLPLYCQSFNRFCATLVIAHHLRAIRFAP